MVTNYTHKTNFLHVIPISVKLALEAHIAGGGGVHIFNHLQAKILKSFQDMTFSTQLS